VPVGWPLFVAFIVALQVVIYTYDGWYGVVYFGGEVHNPGRDIPRAIFGTVFSVLAIYFLVNAAVVHLVSVREFAGSDFAMGIAARRVLGVAGDNFIRIVVVVGLLSSVNAMEMATSRALYAMSRDGLFFSLFARVNKGGIPAPSLWLSTAVACALQCSASSGWRRFSRHFSWLIMGCRSCRSSCCAAACPRASGRIEHTAIRGQPRWLLRPRSYSWWGRSLVIAKTRL